MVFGTQQKGSCLTALRPEKDLLSIRRKVTFIQHVCHLRDGLYCNKCKDIFQINVQSLVWMLHANNGSAPPPCVFFGIESCLASVLGVAR